MAERRNPKGVRFEGGKPSYGRKTGQQGNRATGQQGRRYDDDKPKGRRYDDDKPKGRRYDDDKPKGRRYDDDKPKGKRFDDDKPKGRRYDDDEPKGRRYDDDKPKGKRYDDDKPKGRHFDDDKPKGRKYEDRPQQDTGRESVESPAAMREDELPFLIMGRNAVREAIKSGRSIDKILVVPEHDGSLGEILSMARDRGILIQEERREKLDELCMPFGHGEKTGNHQGIVARVPGADYVEIDDILNYAKERGEKPFILLLDGITDPYNFGSIIRSAECAGVHGIIIPKRRSATLTSSAVKVSAGAASHMRIAKVPNIAGAIDRLKEENIFIAGTDMEGTPMYDTDLTGAMALCIGSEDEGLSQLVAKKCDFIISAPIKGHIDSLNAAVAAAVIMYEKVRQDIIRQ